MLNIIIILILLLILFSIFTKNKNDNETFVSEKKIEFDTSRPNCPQLNIPSVCLNTPGCFSTKNGCINNYKELQEPQKEWEKNDFMIVYDY